MNAESSLYKDGKPAAATRRKVARTKSYAKPNKKRKSKKLPSKTKPKKLPKRKSKVKATKTKTKARAKPAKVSSSRSRKHYPHAAKRKKPVSRTRKPKVKSKKTYIRPKKAKPTDIYILEPGDKIKPGKGLDDLVFNSSHMNSMDRSIEGNIVETFRAAFKGYLSKSPFEADDIVIHGFGVSIRTKNIIETYRKAEFHKEIIELLKPFEGAYTINMSAKGIKIFFKEAFSNNEEVEKLLRERSDVLEEIMAAVRAETRYGEVDWFVNWFTEDAMYDG